MKKVTLQVFYRNVYLMLVLEEIHCGKGGRLSSDIKQS